MVKKTLIAACAITMSTLTLSACGGSSPVPRTTARSPWASPRSAPRAAGVPPTPSRSRTSAKDAGHRAEVLRRAAEAGEPDQGDPLASSRRRSTSSPSRRWSSPAGTRCSRRPRTPKHPGDPDRPRGRLDGHDALQDRSSAPTSSRRARRPASGWSRSTSGDTDPVNIVELQGTTGSAPANDRKKGFARRRSRPTRSSRSSPRRPVTSPAPRARRSWRPS